MKKPYSGKINFKAQVGELAFEPMPFKNRGL
jgi:hypothetical protein